MKQALRYVLLMVLFCSATRAQTNFWQPTSGLVGRSVSALATNASGHVFAATDTGVFRSTNEGASWAMIRSTYYAYSLTIDADGRVFVPGWESNRSYVFRSTDNGDTWERLGNGWTGAFPPFPPSIRVIAHSTNQLFAALNYRYFNDCGGASFWRSTDQGQTWDSLAGWQSVWLSPVAVDRGNRIFASIGCPYYGIEPDRVFRSEDFGASWSPADTGLPHPGYYVSDFAFSSSNEACVGIQHDTVNAIYCSTNNGHTWSFGDTVGGSISAMLFDRSDNLFVATNEDGVFRNGIQVNSGLTDLRVRSLASSPTGYLYAGTSSGGVFRSVLPTVAVQELSAGQPSSFVLYQNYPNPFNPSTTIRFSIPVGTYGPASPAGGHTSLRVFDMLGREVATLVNEEQPAGAYSVSWNATGMASGVYFYRLTAGSFVETRRMILMK